MSAIALTRIKHDDDYVAEPGDDVSGKFDKSTLQALVDAGSVVTREEYARATNGSLPADSRLERLEELLRSSGDEDGPKSVAELIADLEEQQEDQEEDQPEPAEEASNPNNDAPAPDDSVDVDAESSGGSSSDDE